MNILRVFSIGVFFVIGLVGCVHVSAGYFGDDINGRDVEQLISKLAATLKSQDKSLQIEPSTCADRIDVSNGKIAHCSMRINGVDIPVRVVYFGPSQGLKVNLEGQLYQTSQIEKMIVHNLTKNYGLKVTAACGQPVIRLYEPGTEFRCAIRGSPKVTSVRLRALSIGVYFFKPAGLTELRSTSWMTEALHRHKKGAFVAVSAEEAGRFIDDGLASERSVHPEMPSTSKTRCPNPSVLTGNKHAICTVIAKGLHLRWELWIDPVSLRARNVDVLIDRDRVQQMAQQELNTRLAASGVNADALVTCDGGLMVTQPGKSFFCKLHGNGRTGRLQVYVQNLQGMVHWRGVDLKEDSASAAP